MNEIIDFQISEGVFASLEVSMPESHDSGLRNTSSAIKIPKLDDALEFVKSFAKESALAFDSMSESFRPDEVSISLAMSFNAEAGKWFFAKIGTEVEIGVTLGWKNAKKSLP